MNTAQELRAAADYLEQHGWVQGEYGEAGGACCALGALGVIREGDPVGWPSEASDALMEALVCAVGDWNDAPGRTAAEVIATLRAVADIEEAKTAVTS